MKSINSRTMAIGPSVGCLSAPGACSNLAIPSDRQRVSRVPGFIRNKSPGRARALVLGALAVALGLAPKSALAATQVVTTAADTGPGSLRAALAAAGNADTVDATGV